MAADWALTLGLQNLRRQINEAFPDRDHESDGTISDAAHQRESRTGHSPDDTPGSNPEWDGDPDSTPEVRAWDMDSDLRMPGVDAQMVVDHIRALPDVDNELRYMIYNRKIYKASAGWHPAPYSGTSPHIEHIHFSGAWSQAADNDTSFDYRLEELAMPTPAEYAQAVWDHQEKNPYSGAMQRVGTMLSYVPSAQPVKDVGAQVARLAAAVSTLSGVDVDEQAIVQGVLAGLSPEKIAALIPQDIAKQVLDGLEARLAA